jgi:hypothetical protein
MAHTRILPLEAIAQLAVRRSHNLEVVSSILTGRMYPTVM